MSGTPEVGDLVYCGVAWWIVTGVDAAARAVRRPITAEQAQALWDHLGARLWVESEAAAVRVERGLSPRALETGELAAMARRRAGETAITEAERMLPVAERYLAQGGRDADAELVPILPFVDGATDPTTAGAGRVIAFTDGSRLRLVGGVWTAEA